MCIRPCLFPPHLSCSPPTSFPCPRQNALLCLPFFALGVPHQKLRRGEALVRGFETRLINGCPCFGFVFDVDTTLQLTQTNIRTSTCAYGHCYVCGCKKSRALYMALCIVLLLREMRMQKTVPNKLTRVLPGRNAHGL